MKRKSVFFYYVKENITNLIFLVILFFIGILIGIFCINHINQMQMNEISGYIISLKENIKTSEGINKTSLLIESLKHNTLFVIMIWFFGWTLIGNLLIYIAIIYKGFSIGYTVSAIISTLGIRSRSNIFSIIFSSTKFNFLTNVIFISR